MEWFDTQALRQVDYVHARFQIEFDRDFELGPDVLLQLRRELKMARKILAGCCREEKLQAQLDLLFTPCRNPDPRTRKAFPFYPPPFVIQLPENLPVVLSAGDLFSLDVVFWGEGRQLIGSFCRLLLTLGEIGIHRREGAFSIVRVAAQLPDGTWHDLEFGGDPEVDPALPILQALDLVESQRCDATLKFLSPARLLVHGRPLFAPNHTVLLPFFLRRLTGMCVAWCGVEVVPNPAELLARFAVVDKGASRLHWQDWRTLDKGHSTQDLGGLAGEIDLPGPWREELHPLFAIGHLLNLGKGASYGGGSWKCR
ncbi:hypothetical protein C2E25_04750 [Geothermobacter hydrogeniphilus]|uniref:CRISPR-associated protein Cas6 C-terminal domain-containing protein n=1 Tax=Geothermobacter hydrogeniphilus TaxID=1969733 RepID=A0A2K2HC65_9BACT|nr:hypothetical protein [Geothermobacter hydrogeniphilus]PNU20902.1 hypothetical protein C2E25_04750 [Geothermobacter hydrogeniphilus]